MSSQCFKSALDAGLLSQLLGRLRQEDHKVKICLGYIVSEKEAGTWLSGRALPSVCETLSYVAQWKSSLLVCVKF